MSCHLQIRKSVNTPPAEMVNMDNKIAPLLPARHVHIGRRPYSRRHGFFLLQRNYLLFDTLLTLLLRPDSLERGEASQVTRTRRAGQIRKRTGAYRKVSIYYLT